MYENWDQWFAFAQRFNYICKKVKPIEERNDIVIYKSEDGLVKMEAMVAPVNETIWASQKAIAALFGCTKQNVSYHMGKIFASGELERSAVVKEILITAQSGARGLSEEKVLYYNLDAIAESHTDEMATMVKVVVSLIKPEESVSWAASFLFREQVPEDSSDAFLYTDLHSLYAIIVGLLCTTFLPRHP